MKRLGTILASFGIAACINAQTATNVIDVNTSKLGASIQPTMYGIFFEDINFAADGGLYAELIKNRSFEFPDHYMGWKTFGNIKLMDDGPFDKNPHYVRIGYSGHREKRSGLENEGFFGIGYKNGEEYRFSVWARVPDGKEASVRVSLCDPHSMDESQQFAEQTLKVNSSEWKKYELVLQANKTVERGTLRIMHSGGGYIDLEHVSLFPKDTWKGHENGMRKDLAQALYDMKPGVFRFPGGCIVEGTDLESRYQWKNSVGPVENRPLNENRWNYTFAHRLYPDYFQSYGLGFYEYFLLSEEIGAEPLPVLNVGLSCEYQNGSERSDKHVAVKDLQPYIDDVIDLIEFANGDPAKNKWAKLRADMGHPAPFNLKFVAIGNEQWGEIYPENLKPFVEQVRKKYPDIKLIGSSGPNSEGKDFDYLWPEMRKLKVDLVDEHFYRNEQWFLSQGSRYDNYDRKGTKVFAGEYACHGKGKKWNHFEAALYEAAFMTGLERNADVVEMATYAPLFAHVDGWQWRPDLIWYDNLRSFKTCSYYVQQMYAKNKGTNVLKLTMDDKPVSGQQGQNGLFASAVFDKESNEVIIKIVNTGNEAQSVTFNLKGLKSKNTYKGTQTSYSADNMDGDNSLDNPEKYVPETSELTVNGNTMNVSVPAKTFMMYKIAKN